MANMKKHPLIHVDFQSSVKLSPLETNKLKRWLSLGSRVFEQLVIKEEIIHPSWLSSSSSMKVSVLLCGEAKIKKLNADYRGKNKVTDVLSFPSFQSLRKEKSKKEFVTTELFLGDLAICHSKTQKQSAAYQISYWDEFIHLFIHGMIHLLGYDHEISQKEEKIMQNWESLALEKFSQLKKKGAL